MPSIEENLRKWNTEYDWREGGEEWSQAWGGTPELWTWVIRPRLHAFLPAGTILEIGAGHGRIARCLRSEAERLILVDIAETCIDKCRDLFRDDPGVTCHVNDGLHLATVEDSSVDVAVSFDALVHVELDVMRSYIGELARVLSDDGVAFLHHSNLAQYQHSVLRYLPKVRTSLNRAWRSWSVGADLVAAVAQENGLYCASQELVNWQTPLPLKTDCFSLIRRAHGPQRPCRTSDLRFWQSAGRIRLLASAR
jgi:2-polyprenyl-3-methyl-5-hydroxy-6-metoxy-1,4-benzoquinol methylase